jgi:opacity protein-like surface antigen
MAMTIQRTGLRCAAMILTVIAVAHGASAQTAPNTAPPLETGEWTVTPMIGTGFSGDLDSPTVLIGVAGGYNWNPKVSLEGEFNLLPSSESSGVIELSTKIWNVTGNLLYHFSEKPFVPYAAVGLGLGHGSADVNVTDPLLNSVSSSSTEFVFNFGGGVERAIHDGIRFRGDLRYFFGGDLVADYWRLGLGLSFDIAHRR